MGMADSLLEVPALTPLESLTPRALEASEEPIDERRSHHWPRNFFTPRSKFVLLQIGFDDWTRQQSECM